MFVMKACDTADAFTCRSTDFSFRRKCRLHVRRDEDNRNRAFAKEVQDFKPKLYMSRRFSLANKLETVWK